MTNQTTTEVDQLDSVADRPEPHLCDNRLLVVDGDPFFALLAQDALSLIFDEVVAVRDGREAMQQLEGQEFDLVIVNLPGPQSDGVRLISRMFFTACSHDTPIVGLLHADDAATAKTVANFNIERIVAAPIDFGGFVEQIVDVVRSRQQIALCA